MKKIFIREVKDVINDAIKNNKRNILFVSKMCYYEPILEWFDENPQYNQVRLEPLQMWEEDQGGILRKAEDTCVIYDDVLNLLNNENSICYLPYFGDNSYYRIDKLFDIIKDRKYVNILTRGDTKEFTVEKMKLFIAITTINDCYSLSEKYYELFDEVYKLYK